MTNEEPTAKATQGIEEWRKECLARGEEPTCVAYFSSKNANGERQPSYQICGNYKDVLEHLTALTATVKSEMERQLDEYEDDPFASLPKEIADDIKGYMNEGKNPAIIRPTPKNFGEEAQ